MSCRFGLFVALLRLPLVSAGGRQPSILFIVADDLGATDVSWRGAEFPTPHIDGLAYAGIRLDNYYVQLVCSPSRTAFMTGRYPLHTGLNHGVIGQDVNASIDMAHPTIAEVLRDRYGYKQSYLLGKWHNGHAAWNNTPPGRGFEGGWYGWNGGSADYYTHQIGAQGFRGEGYTMYDGLGPRAGRPDPVHQEAKLPQPAWSDAGNYSTELWGDKAIHLIQEHDFENKPFFMYLGFQSPHAPVQPSPDSALNQHCKALTHGRGRDVYCSMVMYMDRKIGEVTQALRERGEFENTLIIFTSDNGGCMPGENRGCNWPMRGGKHHLFEGGIKVTAFVSGGVIPEAARGSTSHALMHATDWFPTLLGMVAGSSATDLNRKVNDVLGEIDGYNLWPALVNISNLNTSTIDPSRTYSPRYEIPHNVDPLLHAAGMPDEPQGAIRFGQWKLVVGDLDVGWLHCNMTLQKPNAHEGTEAALNHTFMLFDLLNDPNERLDLSKSTDPVHQEALSSILERWEYWKTQTVQPNFPDSDPRSYPDLQPGIYHGSWMPWISPTPTCNVAFVV